jgi:hypothetical protein
LGRKFVKGVARETYANSPFSVGVTVMVGTVAALIAATMRVVDTLDWQRRPLLFGTTVVDEKNT